MAKRKPLPKFKPRDLVRVRGQKSVWIIEHVITHDIGRIEYLGRYVLHEGCVSAFEADVEFPPEATRAHVTDHALVRYMERVLDVDTETLRTAILSERVDKAVATLGDGKYPVCTGFVAIVKNHTVVTVRPVK